MNIIGVNGLIESGKSTVSDYLVANYGYTKMSFATALKESAMKLFDLTPDQVFTTSGKASIDEFWKITPREILQKYGTESMRDVFGQDFWVRVLDKKIRAMSPDSKIVIDDVRFLTEAELIKSYGGEIYHVYRKPVPKVNKYIKFLNDINPWGKKVHRSELPLPDHIIDYTFHNTEDYNWLYAQIDAEFRDPFDINVGTK